MIEQFQQLFDEKGFQQPTQIQTAVAETLASGKSVLGIAPTGSGKTLAFAWPLLPKVEPGAGVQILILEPSQELAIQTTAVLREWANLIGVKVRSLTGGANLRRQVTMLKKQHPDVVVGTPGRVLHMLDNRDLKLDRLKTLVIDEADDLLRDDTQAVVEDIERATPLNAQLAFFSATSSAAFDQLSVMFGRDIITYDVRETDQSRGPVRHGLVYARTMSQKTAMLNRLSHTKDFRALVFFDSIKTLHYAASRLKHEHVASATLGGKQRQTERETALRQFRKRQLKLLLTTDVAARGLDIPKLPAVINFELPTTVDQYVHRTGRTGRQGEPGLVINLGSDHDFRDLKKLLADTDYQFTELTVGEKAVTDEKPADGAAKMPVRKEASRAIQKEQRESKREVKKSIHNTLDGFSMPAKRKNRKKNRKNKGIRLKHRRMTEKQSDQ